MKKTLNLKTVILCIISFAFLTSCTKEVTKTVTVTVTPNYPIQGLWIGKYTLGTSSDYYSFNIKQDGTILVETKFQGQQQLATGSWTLTGKQFITNYSIIYTGNLQGIGTVQQADATWDSTANTLIGTWKNTLPSNGVTGTLSLNRVN